jgi:glycosyltransferase involved in cell wall biosynthesis
MPALSIVIRAYNEAAPLEKLLARLPRTQDIELIVVDNGSSDNTAAVAKKHGARTVGLLQEEFSYPKSSNLGIAAATSPIIVLFSAHCLPIHQDWMEAVLAEFDDSKVAGVYGTSRMDARATWLEFVLYWASYPLSRKRKIVSKADIGVLGATNCAIRRDLWEQHPFDEAYGAGGEDTAWAVWALSQGYKIIRIPRFDVIHSHRLGLWGYLRQRRLWTSLAQGPRPFSRADLAFRKDIDHR